MCTQRKRGDRHCNVYCVWQGKIEGTYDTALQWTEHPASKGGHTWLVSAGRTMRTTLRFFDPVQNRNIDKGPVPIRNQQKRLCCIRPCSLLKKYSSRYSRKVAVLDHPVSVTVQGTPGVEPSNSSGCILMSLKTECVCVCWGGISVPIALPHTKIVVMADFGDVILGTDLPEQTTCVWGGGVLCLKDSLIEVIDVLMFVEKVM